MVNIKPGDIVEWSHVLPSRTEEYFGSGPFIVVSQKYYYTSPTAMHIIALTPMPGTKLGVRGIHTFTCLPSHVRLSVFLNAVKRAIHDPAL